MELALVDLLNEIVLIAPVASKDAAGNFTYGTAVAYACRIEMGTKYATTVNGFELIRVGRIYIDGEIPVDAKDKVTLPDGAVAKIGNISREPDEFGNTYYTKLEFML